MNPSGYIYIHTPSLAKKSHQPSLRRLPPLSSCQWCEGSKGSCAPDGRGPRLQLPFREFIWIAVNNSRSFFFFFKCFFLYLRFPNKMPSSFAFQDITGPHFDSNCITPGGLEVFFVLAHDLMDLMLVVMAILKLSSAVRLFSCLL